MVAFGPFTGNPRDIYRVLIRELEASRRRTEWTTCANRATLMNRVLSSAEVLRNRLAHDGV